MTNRGRRVGAGTMLLGVGLLVLDYLLYTYLGWVSWVLVAFAAIFFVRGLLWFLTPTG